jgi:DNA repair protein RadC
MKIEMIMESTLHQQNWQAAEVELIYKTKIKASERPCITSSKDSYDLLKQMWDSNKIEYVEQFKILLLNRGNRVLGIYDVATGGITSTVADVRVIFAAALKANACAIIMAHNHPSGSLKPSRADEALTEKMRQAGLILDIRLLDHLIVTSEGYFSFADEGLI